MKKTINELLVLSKIVRERVNNLKALSEKVSKREVFYSTSEKVVEPTYDVKSVDKKIVELQRFLLDADTAIKKSNAVTEVEIEYSVDKLLEPLQ
jgi:hypothetical protein